MSDGSISTPDFRPSIKEALATHEGLRILGFPADDIYVQTQKVRDDVFMVFVILKASGKEFNIAIAAFDGTYDEFKQQWLDAIKWWNGIATNEQMYEIFKNSAMYQHCGPEIMRQLLERGITIPAYEEYTMSRKDELN